MTDDEIDKLGAGNNYPGTVPGMRKFARAVIAAYTAKLRAGVEMPKGRYIDRHSIPNKGMLVYSEDEMQVACAAAAAQARTKALDEAKGVCISEHGACWHANAIAASMAAQRCADAIEKLREQT